MTIQLFDYRGGLSHSVIVPYQFEIFVRCGYLLEMYIKDKPIRIFSVVYVRMNVVCHHDNTVTLYRLWPKIGVRRLSCSTPTADRYTNIMLNILTS